MSNTRSLRQVFVKADQHQRYNANGDHEIPLLDVKTRVNENGVWDLGMFALTGVVRFVNFSANTRKELLDEYPSADVGDYLVVTIDDEEDPVIIGGRSCEAGDILEITELPLDNNLTVKYRGKFPTNMYPTWNYIN